MPRKSLGLALLVFVLGCDLQNKHSVDPPIITGGPTPLPVTSTCSDDSLLPLTLNPQDPLPLKLFDSAICPARLDSQVIRYTARHKIKVDSRVTLQPQLVVFLPGYNSSPADDDAMLTYLASSLGFRSIGLSYANDVDPKIACAGKALSLNCQGNLRLETLDGIDHSPDIVVGPQDSIDSRLLLLLKDLQRRQPQLQWNNYFDGNDQILWDKIIISGHSHGGGMAGFIAKVRMVARAVMLSGPYDNLLGDPGLGQISTPAQWIGAASATPVSLYFGFSHQEEPQGAQIRMNWQGMGLTGSAETVDGVTQFSSHQLVTDYKSSNPNFNPHLATLAGNGVPNVNGKLYFDAVYRYLFGVN